MKSKSNWYVITGGPSSGIDTVLNYFRERGYRVIPEAARALIDEEIAKGKTIEEIRKDETEFQRRILARKIKIENELSREQTIFLNRAIPDSIAYYRNCGLGSQEVLKICQKHLYKKIFLLEQLPQFTKDYARTENARTAKKLNRLLKKAYEQLGYKVILVPIMPAEERAKFIQIHLEEVK